jgi:hypothetical protein
MTDAPKPNASIQQHVRRIPTVSRISPDGTIIELVYERETRKTALVVSRFGGLWNIEQEARIESGDIVIPYAASNNLIANRCVVLASKPVEFGLKHELLADIQAFLHRYVDLSPVFEQIAAHYVLLTWIHDAFAELPYLRLRGDYGSGKTRALLVLGSICYRAFFASGASTVSPIFHVLDAFGGTLILDEADLPYSDAKADLVKILNNGTMPGVPVLRTVVNRHKEFNPRAFRVFGPKIIAMRGSFEDKALESRFLTEETGMKPLRPDIPLSLPKTMEAEALELRNRLLHYRLCTLDKTKADSAVLIPSIEPRLNQKALALLSVVDDADVRRAIEAYLVAEHHSILAERRDTLEASVLSAMIAAMNAAKGPSVPLKDIAERFNAAHAAEFGKPMPNKWVGHVIRSRLHIATIKTRGVYAVPFSEKPKIDAIADRLGL